MVLHLQGEDDPFKADASYDCISTVEEHDGHALLADWWQAVVEDDDSDTQAASEYSYLETVGANWPGVTSAPASQGSAVHFADLFAELLAGEQAHLALVSAVDGVHALTAVGWRGPLNHDNDNAKFAAVVSEWQDRFGATVVGLGFDTLYLSVAAPPTTIEQALQVTDEHFAFCPDNIWQSSTDTFPQYATAIIDRNWWRFWWD